MVLCIGPEGNGPGCLGLGMCFEKIKHLSVCPDQTKEKILKRDVCMYVLTITVQKVPPPTHNHNIKSLFLDTGRHVFSGFHSSQ